MIEHSVAAGSARFSLSFPHSLKMPTQTAVFRSIPEDFVVEENLGFLPEGMGEHLLIQLRKRDQNTRWVASLLAQYYEVSESAVGYCGLKDRKAVTSQWFSVHLPGATERPVPELSGCEILSSFRHPRKLRPGMHKSNSFAITLRFGPERFKHHTVDSLRKDLEGRLETIKLTGVPNYFGEQRFGKAANNLDEVATIVARKHPRFKGRRGGLYLSAARSWIFNQVLSARVREGTWMEVKDGPMWGRGRSAATEEVTRVETEVLKPWGSWLLALEHSGLKQERRPLVLKPQDLQWEWQRSDLLLRFTLGPGEYATSVLRELAILETANSERDQ